MVLECVSGGGIFSKGIGVIRKGMFIISFKRGLVRKGNEKWGWWE